MRGHASPRALVIAVIATTALVGCGSGAKHASAPSRGLGAPAATAAFGHFLSQRYGAIHNAYLTCSLPAPPGRVCTAEFRTGQKWHQGETEASMKSGRITFAPFEVYSWVRRWEPYSRRPLVDSGPKPYPPGVVSTNLDFTRITEGVYSQWTLADCSLHLADSQARTCTAAARADADGLGRFYDFTCLRDGVVITCLNAMGDAIRYRPG
jgi:hypothetical protein